MEHWGSSVWHTVWKNWVRLCSSVPWEWQKESVHPLPGYNHVRQFAPLLLYGLVWISLYKYKMHSFKCTVVFHGMSLYFCMHVCVGAGKCNPGESHDNDVILVGQSEGRRQQVLLDTLSFSAYRVNILNYSPNKLFCSLTKYEWTKYIW